MSIAIVIGNGFSIDAARHFKLDFHPSYPWSWDIPNPYNKNEHLLEVFPALKKYLNSIEGYTNKEVYESLNSIVKDSKLNPAYMPGKTPNESEKIHNEACHYLRLAYSWFSDQFKSVSLETWPWFQWFQNNHQFIQTLLSYNYDLLLEYVLNKLSIGKAYSGSTTDLLKAEVYMESGPEFIRTIHIAKPHGSVNFTGWCEKKIFNRHSNIPKPLYPIDGNIITRDSKLKILCNDSLYTATSTADIVLPGEWNCWNRDNLTYLEWAQYQLNAFKDQSKLSNCLMIIGFGYGNSDQEEFNKIMEKIPPFKKIQIIDPNPNIELIEFLSEHSKVKIEIRTGISN